MIHRLEAALSIQRVETERTRIPLSTLQNDNNTLESREIKIEKKKKSSQKQSISDEANNGKIHIYSDNYNGDENDPGVIGDENIYEDAQQKKRKLYCVNIKSDLNDICHQMCLC